MSSSSDYIQPNFAYRFAPGWSIGGGPVFGVSHVELRQGIDLAAVPVPGGLAASTSDSSAFRRAPSSPPRVSRAMRHAWGFNVGVHGKFGADWQVGARYLSELKFKYKNADVQFTQQLTNLVLAAQQSARASSRHAASMRSCPPQFAHGRAVQPGTAVNTEIDHPAQFQARHRLHRIHEHDDHCRLRVDRLQVVRLAPRFNFDGPADEAGLSRTLLENYKARTRFASASSTHSPQASAAAWASTGSDRPRPMRR